MALTPATVRTSRGTKPQQDTEDDKKYTKIVLNPETGRKNKVRYGAKGYRIAPGTDKGDRYCARSFGDMKSEGYNCSGAERNTPLCLSRAKWKCSGKTSRRDASLTPGKVLALLRIDALEGGHGKPCGASHIPKSHKCSKGTVASNNEAFKTAAKIALAAGAIAGGAAIAKKAMSMEEWRNHPDNPRNTPKLSPEENQRIIDEALAAGQKWDVQERINAHRLADLQAECGGGLGKIQAPAKFDAATPNPRCQAGAGAFGTYFVHTSEKYGIKLFRNEDEDVDPGWEFDRLGAAHRAGVNVPEPLAINYTKDGTHTLTLRHMKGYREIGDVYSTGGFGLPRIVQLKIARQFRTLHTEGIAHGDIHGGNILVHPRSKRVALVDFGYSTQIYDAPHRIHNRDGVRNLMGDLERLPEFLGLSSFSHDYRGVLSNITKQALDYDRSWDKYERAIKRYYDVLEAELLDGERRSRSRFVSGADQPRIPGITRAILTANANTFQLGVLEQVRRLQPTLFAEGAQNLGLKPAQLYRALAPERKARLRKPFGTTLQPSA